jgi:REP element-mobilizing transposase RayT
MPRQARLDAPDTLHHVMVRGLERRTIFRDDADREDFVVRLAALAEAGALTVYAWALLPNHAHLLVRTGTRNTGREYGTLPCCARCGSLGSTMPRQPRLDAPDTLHHVMVRGLERRAIFRDDADRDEFVARVAALAAAGALTIYNNGGRCHDVHVVLAPPPGPVTPVWLRCRVAS